MDNDQFWKDKFAQDDLHSLQKSYDALFSEAEAIRIERDELKASGIDAQNQINRLIKEKSIQTQAAAGLITSMETAIAYLKSTGVEHDEKSSYKVQAYMELKRQLSIYRNGTTNGK